MPYSPIQILLQDANLNLIADPVVNWTNIDCTLKLNDVGTGEFTAPVTEELMTAVTTPGNRVSVVRNKTVLMSGPIEKPGKFDWSADDDTGGGGPGAVTVNFADNLAYLAWRLVYPDPTQQAAGQPVDFYLRNGSTDKAEDTIADLVNRNAGPGALAIRRIPKLVMGSCTGKGITVALSSRFEPLTDVMRSVALLGGQLAFRVDEVRGQMVFSCYAPRDLTKQVRFSRALGNLRTLSTDPQAPTATAGIAGGTGQGISRLIVERDTADAGTWGRIEKWVSDTTGGTDANLMLQAADNELAQDGFKIGLSATAVDTDFARFGVDYQLGDKVAIELVPGLAPVADVVSSVHITATPEAGELVTATIGTDIAHADTLTINAIRQLEQRVGRLERI